MIGAEKRKKVNYMINQDILVRIKEFIPAGERSDFVNKALGEAILRYARRRASIAMDELAKKMNLRMSTEEFIKLKNYGRP